MMTWSHRNVLFTFYIANIPSQMFYKTFLIRKLLHSFRKYNGVLVKEIESVASIACVYTSNLEIL